MANPVNISIVDYQPFFLSGLANELRADRTMKVVFQGSDPSLALKFAAANPHDAMLLGVEIPSKLDVIEAIAKACPQTRLIVLSSVEDEGIVSKVLGYGAKGYLLRDLTRADLCSAVHAVHSGGMYLTPRLGAQLLTKTMAATASNQRGPRDLSKLTRREDAILAKVTEGLTNKEIGLSLDIGEKTVKYYMTNIMQKLQVRNRVEAAVIVRNAKMKAM